jgi:hypothetical protein
MQQQIDTTRRQIGELANMSAQTEAAERKILKHAETMLEDVQGKIDAVRSLALVPGAPDGKQYQDLIMERGRLQQVIAQAKAVLS